MTIASIAAMARQRSALATGVANRSSGVTAAATGGPETPSPAPDVTRLADAVPVDVIVLYTTVIGVLAGVLKDAAANSYLPLRWGVFIGCIVGICILVPATYTLGPAADPDKPAAPKLRVGPAVGTPSQPVQADADATPEPEQADADATPESEQPRAFPLSETVIAVLSFAFWGLVVPGSPLYVMLKPPTLPVVITTLSAVGVFLLTSLAPPLLKRSANTRRRTTSEVLMNLPV